MSVRPCVFKHADLTNMHGPTLQAAYEQWKQSGRAAEVDAHKDAYLGYIQALL